MHYVNFNADDLRGATLADYLVNIEADFEISEEGGIVYSEPAFPVAELAREFTKWLAGSEQDPGDFQFASISFEDPGAVRILRAREGWVVGSAFTPEMVSSPQPRRELIASIEEFIENVRRDMVRLGIDPDFVLRASS